MGLARQIKRLMKKRNDAAVSRRQRKILFESLEPRLLLSADLAVTTTGTAGDLSPQPDVQEVLFVDSGIADYGHFANIEKPGTEVVLLDGNEDGVRQIGDVLAEYDDLNAVHIVSHGSEAKVFLGDATLTMETVIDYDGILKIWGESLNGEGDILFYGCNIAAGEAGEMFMEVLGQATGADIAASTDDTGPSDLGGDWDLEASAGTIETDLAFSDDVIADYAHFLAPPTVSISGAASVDEGDQYSITLSYSDPEDDPIFYTEINWGDGTIVQYYEQPPDGVYDHTYVDGDPTVFTILASATNVDGTFSADPLDVTVNNVPPIANAGGDQEADEGERVYFDGSFTDNSYGRVSAGGTVHVNNLVITPSGGVLGFYEDWVGYSEAEIFDTLDGYFKEVDDGWDAYTGDTSAFVETALALAFAQTSTPPFEITIVTDASIPEDDVYEAEVYSSGVMSNYFYILGDGGPVDVEFSFDYDAAIYGFGDAKSQFSNDIYLSLWLDDYDTDFFLIEGYEFIFGTDTSISDFRTGTISDTFTLNSSISSDDPILYEIGLWIDSTVYAAKNGSAYQIEWDFGDGTGATGTLTPTHVYADDGNYTVTLKVTDEDGGFTTDTMTMVVNNVAPTVEAGADQTVLAGDVVQLDPAMFNDKGTLDTHGFYGNGDPIEGTFINWGDGTTSSGVVVESPFGPPGSTAGADGEAFGYHIYEAAGTYTITVSVEDDDGGVGSDTLEIVVKPSQGDSSSIGDFVWHDMYHDPDHLVDGIQDSGEPGIEGVSVNLLDADDLTTIATATTDGAGFYFFDGLSGDTYVVEIAQENFEVGGVLEGWYPTLFKVGDDDSIDSDGDPSTHRSEPVALTAGERNPDIDFGYFTTGIALTKTGPETVLAGETITYHFTVENTGDVVLDNGAQVYDPLLNPFGDHEIWSDVLEPGEVVAFDLDYFPNFGLPDMDFEADDEGNALTPGHVIDDEFAAYGITVSTHDPLNHPAMIFDSSSPTGGDWDLGTPNKDFGGPGKGSGGKAGKPGENSLSLDNILIISEDGDSSDPDDNAHGGTFIFEFDAPVVVEALQILDIDKNEKCGNIVTFDADGNVISMTSLPRLGDNSFQVVDVNDAEVSRMEVNLTGSGAIGSILFGGGEIEDEIVNTAVAVGYPVHPDFPPFPVVEDSSSWTVDILQLAQLANVSITSPVNENDVAILTGDITSASPIDILTLQVDWGDGTLPETFTYTGDATSFSESHQYLDDNPSGTPSDDYNVSVTLVSEGGNDSDTTVVTVDNVAPDASITGPMSALPGETVTFEGSFFDPGTLDTHTTGWVVLDHSNHVVAEGSGPEITFTPGDMGNYTVAYSVLDDDTGLGTATQMLHVVPWTLEPDPGNPDQNILTVFGTEGRDKIEITEKHHGREVVLKYHAKDLKFKETYYFTDPLSRIKVYGYGSDDMIKVSEKIDIPAELYGGDGNDKIYGGAGDDLIEGGPGDDKLYGRDGNDVIQGGDGNDKIKGGDGNDILYGGAGNDKLYGGHGDDILIGGSGNNKLDGGSGNNIIIGGDGNDQLHGGNGNDILIGGGGNDEIYGGDGNDIILGGDGNDRLYGGHGNDLLVGGNGNDKLYGGYGNDVLVGGPGNDKLKGGKGQDLIYGTVPQSPAWVQDLLAETETDDILENPNDGLFFVLAQNTQGHSSGSGHGHGSGSNGKGKGKHK